ncbi:hypothetical protein [Roseofilum capinflatum]|uniref:Uncharacterized protein n=1 Tax=Roseofilum capinflatum BLCC-M114 TaxID=3022440 RepID=A0ABT7BDG7_9CYAN|nr:hypothetical protein [Roseofilum capinflatum]MDJ1177211.1 hypothetical protein [Roseofilum capinflatum BLCC-M114]
MKPIDSHSSSGDQEKDDRLVAFLHQYRSCPPSEGMELEDRMMQEIQSLDPEKRVTRSRKKVWVFGAIAASVVLAIGGYARWSTQMASQPLSEAEIASLDQFLQDTWQGIGQPSSSVEDPWFLWEDAPSN